MHDSESIALIVGFLLSEAEYNAEISVQIRPLKDIFIVIFFVSVGLFINPRILIMAIPDLETKKIATRYAKVYNPEIMVIARAVTESEKRELQQIGVDYTIIPMSLEAEEIIDKIME